MRLSPVKMHGCAFCDRSFIIALYRPADIERG
jgi:hypothetical protein